MVIPHGMTQPASTYKIERTCNECGHAEAVFVTKREGAFELCDVDTLLGTECKNCAATTFTTAYQRPDLDFELMKEWATNEDLYLMQQDEDLILADELYLDLILQILDTVSIQGYKRNILMAALCVIVYDNTNKSKAQKNEQLKQRVIAELNKRQDKLKLADNWIMDYIKNVVYPQLALGKQKPV